MIFDGVDVSKGKAMLSQIFDPNRYVHELVVMRYLKPPQPSRASTSGKGKGRVAPPKPTRFNLMVPPVLLPPDPKDKKGIPERQLPFMLDKKHALTAISADVDELIPGDVLVSIDGKSVSGASSIPLCKLDEPHVPTSHMLVSLTCASLAFRTQPRRTRAMPRNSASCLMSGQKRM